MSEHKAVAGLPVATGAAGSHAAVPVFTYDREYYERGMSGFHSASFPVITAYFDGLPLQLPVPTVIDFGCGDGFYASFLKARAHTLDGVDASSALLESVNHVHYRRFECRDLGAPWPGNRSGEYDLVFSVEVIEHIYNYRQFLRNAYDILKPGGYVFLTTTTYFWTFFILLIMYHRRASPRALFDFIGGLFGSARLRTRFVMRFWDFFGGHYHGFTRGSLARCLQAVGFEVEKMEYLHIQPVFPVHYLATPYRGRLRLLIAAIVPLLHIVGQSINWFCKCFDVYAPNILVVARKRGCPNY